MNEPAHLDNCVLVVFGASGDLTKRKLIPALYALFEDGHVPPNFAILGVSRSPFTDEEYRTALHDFASDAYEAKTWEKFSSLIHYFAADATKQEDWGRIRESCKTLAEQHDARDNVLFYLSVAPQFFTPIIENIGNSGMVETGRRGCGDDDMPCWQRIVVEKPFGSDPESAVALNQTLARVFDEDSIYRIDHYLGKELVQNLLVVRFANSLFEPLWDQKYIDHVQITATETVGVEGRGSYYDSSSGGAMRDMVQSHLLQVLSLVAMEPPISLDAADIRTEKIKVFKALRVPTMDQVPDIAVCGQYGAGTVGGEAMIGYRENDGVAPDSQTDTYAAVRFNVDTWRWGGVPFYLRSGKAMKSKKTEIVINFKPTPHCLFRDHARQKKGNQIVISVQPNEGILVRFFGKVPGLEMNIKEVVMDFDYVEQWKSEPPESYAILLNDCMKGDQTLFKHRDEIEWGWQAVQPVLDAWREIPDDDLPNYDAGTWGPVASDALLARDDRYWRKH
jgi:glucose-6-phosphate 1-dehydrogenase